MGFFSAIQSHFSFDSAMISCSEFEPIGGDELFFCGEQAVTTMIKKDRHTMSRFILFHW